MFTRRYSGKSAYYYVQMNNVSNRHTQTQIEQKYNIITIDYHD